MKQTTPPPHPTPTSLTKTESVLTDSKSTGHFLSQCDQPGNVRVGKMELKLRVQLSSDTPVQSKGKRWEKQQCITSTVVARKQIVTKDKNFTNCVMLFDKPSYRVDKSTITKNKKKR